jgi:phosphoribosylglycinamide formyltransferase-1
LVSGRGTNLQSILNAVGSGALDAEVVAVLSNRKEAQGLVRAREAGVEAIYLDPRQYGDRDAFDRAMAKELRDRDVDLVCLAGYMRLVGAELLGGFAGRMLNIHPSLLPSFPGLEAQRQALDYGVKVSGATVHLVTAELDGGPIVLQSSVPVLSGDTIESLSARILVEEHRLYPEAIRVVLAGGWRIEGRRFVHPVRSDDSSE